MLTNVLIRIISLIGGGIGGALEMVTNLLKTGFQTAIKFHKEGIAFAREVGLSAKEAQAYTEVLTERTEKLAIKYGVAAEAIKEVQRGIVDATGKQYMLSDAEAERQVQINKLVGAGTSNQFTEQMMNHMGAQLSTVQGAVSKAYATAAKSGLNAAKFSKEVAKNLSLANKLSFRDGVNGIIRMTALSEKLGFNLQSIEGAASKFLELDSSIESAAHLQMLGGAAGVYGSNPLTMAYEANYDPEAFTERLTKMLGGYAQFDRKTGMASINGMNMDFVRNIAKALGISQDEAVSMAKKQAEVKYKESAYSREIGNISKENRDAVLNRSYIDAKSGHLMINDARGNAHDITRNGLDETILEELQKFDNMSELDIMKSQASSLTNIQEQLDGFGESFAASIAKYLNGIFPGLTQDIKKFGNWAIQTFSPVAESLGENIPKWISNIEKFINEHGDGINTIANFLTGNVAKFISFASDHWIATLGVLGALKLGKMSLGSGFGLGLGRDAKGKLGKGSIFSRAGKGSINTIKTIWKEPFKVLRNTPKEARLAFRAARREYAISRTQTSRLGSLKNSFSRIKQLKNAGQITNLARFAKSGGLGIAGAIGNNIIDSKIANGSMKKGGGWHYTTKMAATAAEYAGVGALYGPHGAVIGAIFGGLKGAYDTWKSLPENADKNILDAAKTLGGNILGGIRNAFSFATDGIGEIFSKVSKDIKERGGLLTVALNAISTPIRMIVKVIESLASPIESTKRLLSSAKNWWDSDNKWGKIYSKAKDILFGEKHSDGGVIGAKPKESLLVEQHASGGIVGGDSYVGDKVITGLNSGEMVLNKDQQAQLFNFIKSASSLLTKTGSSNSVTYYTATSSNNVSSNNPFNSVRYSSSSVRSSSDDRFTMYNPYNGGNNINTSYSSLSNNNDNKTSLVNALYTILNSSSSSVSSTSSVLTRIGASRGVTYFSANNPSSIVANSSHSNYDNGDNISSVYSPVIKSDNKIKTLSNILSTIFNSNSNVVSNALNTNTSNISTVPFGDNSFKKIPEPSVSNQQNVGGEIRVKDINVNLSGTIRLDARNSFKNIDINELLNDTSFISELKNLIKLSINNDINGGRMMNDNATFRGMLAQVTTWGMK